jgi:multidrug efflux pump subunit AcrA (membrane-fusion protein)
MSRLSTDNRDRGRLFKARPWQLTLVALLLMPVISYGLGTPFPHLPDDSFAIAQRAPLEVTIEERGEIESARQTIIISQCEWRVPLLWIAEEGVYVNAGDVLAELDSSELQQQAKQREVKLMQAQAELQKIESDRKIQQLNSESEAAQARLQSELTSLKLSGYNAAEYPQQRHALEREVVLAQEALLRSQKKSEFVSRMVRLGYDDPSQRETERLNVMRAQQKLDQQKRQLDVLCSFDHQRQVTELSANDEEALRSLQRVKWIARAAELNSEIRIQAYRRLCNAHESVLNRIRRSIEACTVRAPQAGQFLQLRSSENSYEGLKAGDQIRYQQSVAQLPDRNRLQVNLRLHESRIRQIAVNQPVLVAVDAFPDTRIPGVVQQIGSVPQRGRFPNYDLRDYQITVMLQSEPEQLQQYAPGMTATARIFTAQKSDALTVPVASVIEVSGRRIAFVRTGDDVIARDVETGIVSDTSIEILSGLAEGDQVVAIPRQTCSERISAMQLELSQRLAQSFWNPGIRK